MTFLEDTIVSFGHFRLKSVDIDVGEMSPCGDNAKVRLRQVKKQKITTLLHFFEPTDLSYSWTSQSRRVKESGDDKYNNVVNKIVLCYGPLVMLFSILYTTPFPLRMFHN
jgi:hypothetical protein